MMMEGREGPSISVICFLSYTHRRDSADWAGWTFPSEYTVRSIEGDQESQEIPPQEKQVNQYNLPFACFRVFCSRMCRLLVTPLIISAPT